MCMHYTRYDILACTDIKYQLYAQLFIRITEIVKTLQGFFARMYGYKIYNRRVASVTRYDKWSSPFYYGFYWFLLVSIRSARVKCEFATADHNHVIMFMNERNRLSSIENKIIIIFVFVLVLCSLYQTSDEDEKYRIKSYRYVYVPILVLVRIWWKEGNLHNINLIPTR